MNRPRPRAPTRPRQRGDEPETGSQRIRGKKQTPPARGSTGNVKMRHFAHAANPGRRGDEPGSINAYRCWKAQTPQRRGASRMVEELTEAENLRRKTKP